MQLIWLVSVAVLLVVGGLAALITWAVRHHRRAVAGVVTSWYVLADEIGGEFRDASGAWYRRKPFQVNASVNDIDVVLDSFEDAASSGAIDIILDSFHLITGQAVVRYTRATAKLPTDHSFFIRREHELSGIGKKLGIQDIEIGDAEYDGAFLIKADDESWIRDRLTDGLRRLHLQHPDVSLTLRKGELAAVKEGLVDDREVLRALLALAAAGARTFG